ARRRPRASPPPGGEGRNHRARGSFVNLIRRLLRLVVEAGRRFGRKAAALACERLAAGESPIAGGGATRKRLPAVGPIAQAVTMPGRLDVERIKVELLP